MAKAYTSPEIAIYNGEELVTTLVASTYTLEEGDPRHTALIERGTPVLMADEAKFEAMLNIALEEDNTDAEHAKVHKDPRREKTMEWRRLTARNKATPDLWIKKTLKCDKHHERFIAKKALQCYREEV